MRITLEYSDEDRQEAERAIRVTDYGLVLWDMDQWLRGYIRYKDKEEWPDAQQVRTKLCVTMEQHGVDFPE